LYFDAWFHITAQANTSGTAAIRMDLNDSPTGSTNNQFVTPGYNPTTTHRIICDGYGGMFR
jgi:hypothetical protein